MDDGEGLDDPQEGSSLQDRLPIPETDTTEDEKNDDTDCEKDSDPSTSNNSQPEEEYTNSNDENDNKDIPPIKSKYFGGMVEKEILDNQENNNEHLDSKAYPTKSKRHKKTRRATHDYSNEDETSLSSVLSEIGDGDVSGDILGKRKKNKIRYLPDNTRCDQCFVHQYICNKDDVGIPCSRCKTNRVTCRNQTPETRNLILPEDRHKKKMIK